MTTEKTEKNVNNYCCKPCYFNTSNKTDFNRHLTTHKHKNNVLTTDNNAKNEKLFICKICEKKYNDRAGLWRHKKICIDEKANNECHTNNNVISNNNLTSINNEITNNKDELIIMLVKQNSELIKETADFKSMMMEVIKNGTHNTNNSNNKTFNLQFFLNETCKDAMNIMDFVDSVKLQLSDLENVGKLGFVDGISSIITKNLNNLEIQKRPIHCTDSKREIMYVKDEGKWYNDSKEEEQENKKLKKAIKHIANKNAKLLSEFKAKYPDCIYSDSKKSDQYNKIILEAFGGYSENLENENKIIKKIAKEVTIKRD